MTRPRIRLAAVTLFAALAITTATAAAAASSTSPPLGSWSLGSGTGFSASGSGFALKKGKGGKKSQVFLGDFHMKLAAQPPCEVAPNSIVKLPGSFALKQFGRAGVTAWGIGKNEGGEPYYAPTSVLVDGKSEKGYFYMLWSYSDPSVVMRGGVAFGSCTLEFNGGAPR
jgi:hypothetical protein